MSYTLYINIIEARKGFSPIIKLEPHHEDIPKLMGAANTVLSKVVITRGKIGINEFGEIERGLEQLPLTPCIWQYFEEYDAYIGVLELEYEPAIHVLCLLKEDK